MAVTLYERHDSREVTVGAQGGSVPLRWTAVGVANETELYLAVLETAPLVFGGFLRAAIRLTPLGGPVWSVEVTYGTEGAGGTDTPVGTSGLGGDPPAEEEGSPAGDEPLGPQYSVQMSGGTRHETQSRRTFASVLRADLVGVQPLPDFKRAIGVTENSVEGVEAVAPSLEWAVTVNRASMTFDYMKDLRHCIGGVNISAFYGFPAETLLYLGCDAASTQDNQFSVTHKFRYEPFLEDEADRTVCDGLVLPVVPPHHHVWVKYAKEVEDGFVAPRPVAAYVEQIYPKRTFTLLQIGG